MTRPVCEHGYYADVCDRCPRICYRCKDTGYIQCGDNNTGQIYDCTCCPWVVFQRGAAVAFGLMGMAPTVGDRYASPELVDWFPTVGSVHAVLAYVLAELTSQGVLDVGRVDISAVRREIATALGLLPDYHGSKSL